MEVIRPLPCLSDSPGVRSVFVLSGVLLAIVSVIAYKDKTLFVKNNDKQETAFH
jgi:MFS transporter, DHA3 family, macrolide efflux protein